MTATDSDRPRLRRPESVLVVVYTLAGDVLLLHRRQPVFWQSVTGSLEHGETATAAAVRELAEETGLTACDLIDCAHSYRFEIKPAWQHKYPVGVRYNTEHVFLCPLAERLPVTLSETEHSDYCWKPFDQACDRVWSWSNREALESFVAPRLGL